MSLGGFLNRQTRPDHRSDASVSNHRPDRLRHRRDDFALAVRPGRRPAAQRGADDMRSFAEQLADVEFALDAALHADDDQLAVGGQRVDIAVQVGRAHDVEDHVGARAVGRFPHPLDEVLVAIVDQDLGAQFAARFQLGRRSRGDGDPGAQCAGDLDGVAADAAGAAVHQQQLTLAQVRRHRQVRPDRAGHLRHTGGVVQVEADGMRQQLAGGNGDVFGVAAAGQQSADLFLRLHPGDLRRRSPR